MVFLFAVFLFVVFLAVVFLAPWRCDEGFPDFFGLNAVSLESAFVFFFFFLFFFFGTDDPDVMPVGMLPALAPAFFVLSFRLFPSGLRDPVLAASSPAVRVVPRGFGPLRAVDLPGGFRRVLRGFRLRDWAAEARAAFAAFAACRPSSAGSG